MNQPPTLPAESRPAGNQFSLRGLFILITAVSLVLALLALVIRQPLHWLGALGVAGFCLAMIAALEGLRRAFPPPAQRSYVVYTRPQSIGANPFGSPPAGGESPFAPRVPASKTDESSDFSE
jgi:hypothetical protein